jgi:hypothetical protein
MGQSCKLLPTNQDSQGPSDRSRPAERSESAMGTEERVDLLKKQMVGFDVVQNPDGSAGFR